MLRLRPALPPRAPRARPTRAAPAGAAVPALAPAAGTGRVALHVLLAALPLLAISAHVFDLVPMQLSAALLVVPLATAVAVLTLFDPHPADRIVAHGLAWGVVACAVYDVFRLDTVYMLGLWGDFIPTMGTWITGRPGDTAGGAVVGYLWRYIGDGGGIGLTFFVVASACGLHRLSRARVVLAAVGFAVAPVWAGLVGTVALAPRGEELMFPLTPVTVSLSLVGHLIFGLVLGLGFWHSRAVQSHWPWPTPALPARLRTTTGAPGADATPPPAPRVPLPRVPVPHLPAPDAAVPDAPAHRSPAPQASGPHRRVARPAEDAGPGVFVPRQRTSSTPPAARTLDPDTWEQWHRRLESTQPGRRAHGRREPEPVRRGPA
ncbi:MULTISPECIES: hypothetical protein [unclassified Pseudonocardia]|uniref:hypothetical protein n=1 Tax=unclassified Pseudonocardia TaxID=2619320 RepID=UPI0007610146|nr:MULTISPECIES: hypothetical protein [unclassified Pseudonocardia]OLM19156.1 hypothetical protein Ae707Ps1_3415 [Pseudonocardia sp. Ae707_Ps1]